MHLWTKNTTFWTTIKTEFNYIVRNNPLMNFWAPKRGSAEVWAFNEKNFPEKYVKISTFLAAIFFKNVKNFFHRKLRETIGTFSEHSRDILGTFSGHFRRIFENVPRIFGEFFRRIFSADFFGEFFRRIFSADGFGEFVRRIFFGELFQWIFSANFFGAFFLLECSGIALGKVSGVWKK